MLTSLLLWAALGAHYFTNVPTTTVEVTAVVSSESEERALLRQCEKELEDRRRLLVRVNVDKILEVANCSKLGEWESEDGVRTVVMGGNIAFMN